MKPNQKSIIIDNETLNKIQEIKRRLNLKNMTNTIEYLIKLYLKELNVETIEQQSEIDAEILREQESEGKEISLDELKKVISNETTSE